VKLSFCAIAAIGHAAAAIPRSVMKSRRCIRSRKNQPLCKDLSLPHFSATIRSSAISDVGRIYPVPQWHPAIGLEFALPNRRLPCWGPDRNQARSYAR
jgi:hypothetical protein